MNKPPQGGSGFLPGRIFYGDFTGDQTTINKKETKFIAVNNTPGINTGMEKCGDYSTLREYFN